MLQFSKVFVITESVVFLKVMERILSPHAEEVLTASSIGQGRKILSSCQDISLVLADAFLSDGSGIELLEFVNTLGDARPRVILLTTKPAREEADRALQLGAIGFLSKPVSFQTIAKVWKQSRETIREIARRVRIAGTAILIEPDESATRTDVDSHLAWDIGNVSVTGAFLETKGPIPVHTELRLALDLGLGVGHVKAEVVRVQQPSWEASGGVGVVFKEFGPGTQQLLADCIDLAIAESA